MHNFRDSDIMINVYADVDSQLEPVRMHSFSKHARASTEIAHEPVNWAHSTYVILLEEDPDEKTNSQE